MVSLIQNAFASDRAPAAAEALDLRAETGEGVLVVIEAAVPLLDRRAEAGFVGVWADHASEEVYLYDALLLTPPDLDGALAALGADLGIGIEAVRLAAGLGPAGGEEDRGRWTGRGGAGRLPGGRSMIGKSGDGKRSAEGDPGPAGGRWQMGSMRRFIEVMGFRWPHRLGPGETGFVCGPCTYFDDSEWPVRRRGRVFVLIQAIVNRLPSQYCCCCGGDGGSGPPGDTNCDCLADSACDDRDACNGLEYCDCHCFPGTPPDCNDGNVCTDDECFADLGCRHFDNALPCESDGNPCTQDVCYARSCTHPPDDGVPCDDENECTEDDVCSGGLCAGSPVADGTACDEQDEDPCTVGECDSAQCVAVAGNDGADCEDDDEPCTQDICADGVCTHPSVSCDDDDPCTWNSCDLESGVCVFTDLGTPVDTCAQNGWMHSASPPEIVFVNNDDDNGNGVADYLESNSVPSENDLVAVPVSVGWGPTLIQPQCFCEDTSEYHVNIGSEVLAVHLNPDGTGSTFDLPQGALPDVVYAEGYGPSTFCGAPMYVQTTCCSLGHACTVTTQPMIVAQVVSLAWEKAVSDNAELSTCSNNGGVRIFPDWISPTDSPTPPERRQYVKLVARVQPPIAGVTVCFKVFDVDDPFDQLHGPNTGLPDPDPGTSENEAIIADVDTLDSANPTGGPDNRGANGGLFWNSSQTDAEGKAFTTFVVSMQPGDNFRAAASVLPGAVTQPTTYDGESVTAQEHADALSVTTNAQGQFLPNGGFSGYSCPRTWSPMLTVWRKLHVEVDSMSQESQAFAERHPVVFEYEACLVESTQADFPGSGFTTVRCEEEQERAGYPGIDFHEGGAFWCEE